MALSLIVGSAAADTRHDGKRIGHDRVDPEIRAVMERPRYRFASWGLLVEDLGTGRVLQRLDPDEFFLPGSTTKLFTVSPALDTLGADHRFVTPLRTRGDVASGVLDGDLILDAVGDLTLGGRDLPDGTVAFENFDHMDANAIDGATLTPVDPLSGLDRLAEQVAAAGTSRIAGEVIIDDRLFETIESRPEVIVSPIIVNDNLIDFVITPAGAGQPAQVTWRPMSAALGIDADVATVAAGEATDIEISGEVADGLLVVRGQIADDKGPLVRVHPVRDPASFARILLIETLVRAGVAVDAAVVGDNPTDLLPSEATVATLPVVATLVSAPLSEYAKLIFKVSHNLGAEVMAALIAAEFGERTLAEGLERIGEILPRLGVSDDAIALQSSSGLDSNRTTPRAAVDLLRHLHQRPDFDAIFEALPVLGVDGSLALVQTGHPAAGHVHAKTGTGITLDLAHARPFMTNKALAGYIESSQGRLLAFSLHTNGVLLDEFEDPILGDVFQVNDDLGEIAAIIWAQF